MHDASLVESIRTYGLLENLVVRPLGEDAFEIVAGHRRFAAITALGIERVPCTIVDVDERRGLVLQVVENQHRKQLLSHEIASAASALLDAGLSRDDAARALSISMRRMERLLTLQSKLCAELLEIWHREPGLDDTLLAYVEIPKEEQFATWNANAAKALFGGKQNLSGRPKGSPNQARRMRTRRRVERMLFEELAKMEVSSEQRAAIKQTLEWVLCGRKRVRL